MEVVSVSDLSITRWIKPNEFIVDVSDLQRCRAPASLPLYAAEDTEPDTSSECEQKCVSCLNWVLHSDENRCAYTAVLSVINTKAS